jgi:hypothetical protein
VALAGERGHSAWASLPTRAPEPEPQQPEWPARVHRGLPGIERQRAAGIQLNFGDHYPFIEGRLKVLGILIHELAHVAGATDFTTKAEDALVHCGLATLRELTTGINDPSTPYDPGSQG